MARQADPVITVLRYFEAAGLALAQQALTLAKETIKRRLAVEGGKGTAVPATRRTRGPNKPKPAPAAVTPPTAVAPAVPAAGPKAPRQRRPATPADAPATSGKVSDLALPGIGPSTVGD